MKSKINIVDEKLKEATQQTPSTQLSKKRIYPFIIFVFKE